MYHTINNKFFEVVNPAIEKGRLGHEITISANPVIKIYPLDSLRKTIEFPVFV